MVNFVIKPNLVLKNFIQCISLIALIHTVAYSTCSPLSSADRVSLNTSMVSAESEIHYWDSYNEDDEKSIQGSTSLRSRNLPRRYYFYVLQPNFPCDPLMSCSDKYNGLSLNCSSEGKCECIPPLCWVYTVKETWFSVDFAYTCGKCGELGSECNYTIHCDPPGFCARDGFCHCLQGEHKEDICFVKKSNAVVQILEGSLFILVFLVIVGIMYNTLISYRRNRTLCWCRPRRRRRRRRRRQERAQSQTMEGKSPAYTSQQRIMQNFHHLDESTSGDDLTEDENCNNEESEKSISTTETPDHPQSECKDVSEAESYFTQIDHGSNDLEQNTDKTSSSDSFDTSGMTEYFNTHTTDL